MPRPLTILLLLLLVLLPCRDAAGQDPGEGGKQFAFAESLFQERDYFRAITEYKRFAFLYPGDAARVEASRFRIGECYFLAERWEEAVEAFRQFVREFPLSPRVDEALLYMGAAEKKRKRYDEALSLFDAVAERGQAREHRNRGVYEGALVLLEKGDWQGARERFLRVGEDSPLRRPALVYFDGLQKEKDLPRKDPAVAGTLAAILPGAGHLYTDRPKDALVAFLLNGAFIWAAVELFDDGNTVAGAVVTFFELGWYTGNIYSAVGSAHKYNRRIRDDHLKTLKEQALLSRRDGHGTPSLCFAFNIPF
jgi:tetratricopeptide (TPR) repeat protein